MNTSVEKGLSQGSLHFRRDYGSSTTYYAEIEGSGDNILREFEEAQRIPRFGEGEALAVHDFAIGGYVLKRWRILWMINKWFRLES